MKRNFLLTSLVSVILLVWSLNAFSLNPLLALFIAKTHKSCPLAYDIAHPQFCQSFRNAATCRCVAAGLPSGMCNDMNSIYKRMITIFGSQQSACEYQKDTPYQICMDDWNCYRLGGRDSTGRLCSGAGTTC